MTRFKELKRIEDAIKNKDQGQLLWAVDYCKMRMEIAPKIGLQPKAVKSHIKTWQNILDKVELALS